MSKSDSVLSLQECGQTPLESENSWQPIIFKNGTSRDGRSFSDLQEQGAIRTCCDTLQRQLKDLQAALHPKRNVEPTDSVHLADVDLELHDLAEDSVDRWVYYPWSGTAVRVLAPKLYNRLRLDRNRNKITESEQACLAQKTVGVVGLSVGNAIALSLAMEGLCGHLKLADMDTIDLSNMNRLRVRVDEIGLPKTVVAARQIFEINPYANVSIYSDGIHDDNLEEFLIGDRKLDVLVEECDDIRLKFRLREMACRHRIPVIMETSDRGMLDVERFDEEPDRKPFHGLCDDIVSSQVPARMNQDDKVAFALPILGSATVSSRMAASMIEVDESLSTWPQLGSEVALGGATVAAAVRRIALGLPMTSGRRFIDLQSLLEEPPESPLCAEPLDSVEASARNHPEQANGLTAHANESVLELVNMACKAPSGGNSQPWRFYQQSERLWVTIDRQRAKNSFDPQHRGAYLAIGAAIKNIELTASHFQWNLSRLQDESCRHPDVVASYSVASGKRSNRESDVLFEAIGKRVTNRGWGSGEKLERQLQSRLIEIANDGQCLLRLADDKRCLSGLAEILGECDRIRFLNERLHRELVAEVRWTPREAALRRDGLDLESLQLSSTEMAGMRMLQRPEVAAALRETGGGNALKQTAQTALATASTVGLFSIEGASRESVVQAGKTLQTLWLYATSCRLSLHPMTAAIYMFQVAQDRSIFNAQERKRLQQLQEDLQALFGIRDTRIPLMLFRLARGVESPTNRSRRRPVAEVLFPGPPVGALQS